MATCGRPPKLGLDYFPLVTKNDDKLDHVVTKLGVDGFGVVISLFQRIYEHGYYLPPWKEAELKLFLDKLGITEERYLEIVAECTMIGLFDKDTYEKHGVLTSNGIQERYAGVSRRRRVSETEFPYIINNTLRELLQTKIQSNAKDVSNNSGNCCQQKIASSELLHTENQLNGINVANCGKGKGKGKGKDTNNIESTYTDTISKEGTNNILSCLDSPQGGKSRRVYSPGEKPYDACKWLIAQIKSLHPKARVPAEDEPGFQKWCNIIRLMNERDNRDWYDFYTLVEFMKEDDFWSSLLLSAAGIRKNWDTIWGKYERINRSKGGEREWENVVMAIRRFGRNRREDALASLSPRTASVVKEIGWLELCNSSNLDALKARFLKAWR